MRLVLAVGMAALCGISGCDADREGREPAVSASASASAPPWEAEAERPTAPRGMVYVPPGALVAGTPPDVLPRIVDEEMPGEQVILKGFFISVLPYPNEEGAIPLSNVTRAEAEALCADEGKRLCTELEWERACKGPDNHLYEYGDHYRPEICGTGAKPRMLPSGLKPGCRSDFGVRDMHGGLWEWTASPWGRGEKGDLATVRGGNAPAGELVGRCANAMGRPPDAKSPIVGFRCCDGPQNEAEVVLDVVKKRPLVRVDPIDRDLASALVEAMPPAAKQSMRRPELFRVARLWRWQPVGNEALVVGGGCAGGGGLQDCGVIIARARPGRPAPLAWADSGRYVPTVRVDRDRRILWVYGGDTKSHFRRRVDYRWGSVVAGNVSRNVAPVQ